MQHCIARVSNAGIKAISYEVSKQTAWNTLGSILRRHSLWCTDRILETSHLHLPQMLVDQGLHSSLTLGIQSTTEREQSTLTARFDRRSIPVLVAQKHFNACSKNTTSVVANIIRWSNRFWGCGKWVGRCRTLKLSSQSLGHNHTCLIHYYVSDDHAHSLFEFCSACCDTLILVFLFLVFVGSSMWACGFTLSSTLVHLCMRDLTGHLYGVAHISAKRPALLAYSGHRLRNHWAHATSTQTLWASYHMQQLT